MTAEKSRLIVSDAIRERQKTQNDIIYRYIDRNQKPIRLNALHCDEIKLFFSTLSHPIEIGIKQKKMTSKKDEYIQKWIQMKWVPANYSAYFLTKPRHTFRAFGVLRFNSGDSSNAIFNSKFLIFFFPFGMKKISSFYWMSKERKRLRGAFITFHSCQDSTEFIQEFFTLFWIWLIFGSK